MITKLPFEIVSDNKRFKKAAKGRKYFGVITVR